MPPAAASKPFDPKMTAYILGGCALAILIGVFTKSWMSGRGGLGGVGPLGVEVCFGGTCQGMGWDGAPGDVQLIAYFALLSGIAAAAACAWMAFLTLSNTPNKFPAFKIINGALGLGAAGTTFFLVRLLIEGKELSISWSPVFGIGGVIAGGIFIRKLRPYWPGQGNMPWPVAVAARPPMGQLPPAGGFGQPYGQPQQPFGAPPSAPPFGAPPGAPPFGAPMNAPPGAPPMGAAPMGPPPMGGAPMGGAPMGGAPFGAPMNAPPSGPPMGAAPMGAPPMQAMPPMGSPSPYGAPSGNASPTGQPYGSPPMGAPNPPPAGAPLPYAPTMAAPQGNQPAAPQNKATILGAPAPQLAAILKQQPPAQTAGAAPAAQAQFCPRCGKPMTFVAQYQRWFCQGCQQYA